MDQLPIHTATPDELRRAILSWLKAMPKHIWRPYEQMLAIDPKLRRPEHRADPRDILATYLAEKFTRIGWSVTYPERNLFCGNVAAPADDASPPAS